MIINNGVTQISVIPVAMSISGPIKDYMAGRLNFDQFVLALRPLITAVDNTAKQTSWGGHIVPKLEGLQLTLDHPFSMNSVMAIVTGGTYTTKSFDMITAKGRKVRANVQFLTAGSLFLSPLTSLLTALSAHEVILRLERDPELSAAQRATIVSRKKESELEINRFRSIDPAMIPMAEEAIHVDGTQIHLHKAVELGAFDGFESVPWESLPERARTAVADYKLVTASYYQQAKGYAITVAEMAQKLEDAGVAAWLSSDYPWLRLPAVAERDVTLSEADIKLIETDYGKLLAFMPQYANAFYDGRSLTTEEVGALAADFASVLRRIGVESPRFPVGSQYDSLYHFIADLFDTTDPDVVLNVMACVEYVNKRITFDLGALPVVTTKQDIEFITLLRNTLHLPRGQWPQQVRDAISLNRATNQITTVLPSGVTTLVSVAQSGSPLRHRICAALMDVDEGKLMQLRHVYRLMQELAYTTMDKTKTSQVMYDKKNKMARLRYDIVYVARLLGYYINRADTILLIPGA